jgi:pyruvate formate lyase activating enzyme
MQIAGIQKFTLVDFPGKIAATVFTRGCSFRCGFCHNPELVLPEEFIPLMDEEEIMKFFEKRVGQLQAVCITGGEPTLQADIIPFIQKMKKLGYAIKLDSNGSFPTVLEKIIQTGLIDYIAMDIKASPEKYSLVTNTGIKVSDVKKSIKLIMESGIDYEFRTTVCHLLHKVSDFEEMGELIKGAKRYYIQNFVQSKHIDEHQKFKPFTDEELQKAKKIMEKYCKEAEIR